MQGLTGGFAVTMRQMVEEGGFEIASLAGRFTTHRPNEELEGIRSDAITQCEWLCSPEMRADLKKDGMDFTKMKTGAPITIYAILPANMLEIEAQGVWLRLVVSEALRANLTGGGRRCLFIMDEFPAMGNLALVERLFAVTRDYRIQMWPVVQSLEMLQKHYPNSWQTMLAQCGAIQSFRCGDWTTAEYLAKRAGTDTAVAASYNSSKSRSYSGGQHSWSQSDCLSFAQVAVPYLRPEELFGLGAGEMIGYVAGIRSPVPFYAPMYFDSAVWAPRALPNPYYGR
jgi:type IV secretion system protein VirD4